MDSERRRNMCRRAGNQPAITFSGLAPVPADDVRVATRPLGYRDDTGTRVVAIWADVASGPSKLPVLICRPASFFHRLSDGGASLRHSSKASASTSSSSRPSICFADSIAPHEIGSKSAPSTQPSLPIQVFFKFNTFHVTRSRQFHAVPDA